MATQTEQEIISPSEIIHAQKNNQCPDLTDMESKKADFTKVKSRLEDQKSWKNRVIEDQETLTGQDEMQFWCTVLQECGFR